ncbi:MAG: PEP-CTERM sorting domain-containing protein [Phycisphaerae bacterium]
MVAVLLAGAALAAPAAMAASYTAFVVPIPAGFSSVVSGGVTPGTVSGYAFRNTGGTEAFRWDGNPASLTVTNLNPLTPPGSDSGAFGAGGSGSQIVGFATPTGTLHAALWTTNASSFVDLQPVGADASTTSAAYATNGTTQVGVKTVLLPDGTFLRDGSSTTQDFATAWTGTAGSSITLPVSSTTLTPGGVWENSKALAIATNGTIAGYGYDSAYGVRHAFLWSNGTTGATVTDLDPGLGATTTDSIAKGVDANHVVGDAVYVASGDTGLTHHAVLWTVASGGGVTTSILPITSTYLSANAYGVSGSLVVGSGVTVASPFLSPDHALVWENLATSYPTDLHGLLPVGVYESSVATSVDSNGVIFGYATLASDPSVTQAVIWAPSTVPEPATLGLLGLGVMGLLARKRR